MNDSFITLENVVSTYKNEYGGDSIALDGISLKIERGEYIAVIGRNGSGKSTLAKLLNMILEPVSGKIYVDGVDITSDKLTDEQVLDVRRKIGMVFQNPDNQLVATIVEEDIAFGPENLGVPSEEIRKRVDESLRIVDMSGYARHEPNRLSGGQKQRIAIAGVLAMDPECIILDESTAMLDPKGRKEVINTIEMLNKTRGITVMLITHYMNEAVRAKRVLMLHDGRLVYDGSSAGLFSKPRFLRQYGLDVPQSIELVEKLKQRGVKINSDPVTPEECVRVIAEKYRVGK